MSQSQLPYSGRTPEETRVFQAINQLILGNSANSGTFTLDPSAASTTFKNSRVNADTVIIPMATTANAASEMASGSFYVSAVTKGEFTVAHQNNAQTDRTFKYIHVG